MDELLPSHMETLPGYNWFVIVCSWDLEAEGEAIERFEHTYHYLNKLREPGWLENNKNDPRAALDVDSLKALNLIGRRKFVIVCQTRSHKVLLELSKRIGLRSPVKVEVLPASHVHDVFGAVASDQKAV
jgi:hypothetical protein